jgi:hypothetical protein
VELQKPNRSLAMKLSKSVAELQREHVVLELECIYRMGLGEPHALLESLRPPRTWIRMRIHYDVIIICQTVHYNSCDDCIEPLSALYETMY